MKTSQPEYLTVGMLIELLMQYPDKDTPVYITAGPGQRRLIIAAHREGARDKEYGFYLRARGGEPEMIPMEAPLPPIVKRTGIFRRKQSDE